ncbi:MAG: S8 family serine peptidase [Planctomycetes bacterium]|nr:S8 family serine peptidase [Planctomycetota bacterium]
MERVFATLRSWFRADRTPMRRRHRLMVEILEDRLAPAGDFRTVIGADAVQSIYPYRGTGYTVAVLDTGIDYNDTDLGGGFGSGKRVVAGYDFINNDADPMDDNGHGTHLAGIIGSSNPTSPGIAPDVHFAALKVLDANMNGNWTAVDNALQWVIANQSKFNIVGVNLSLGSGNYTTNPYNLLENDFTTLKNLGVFTAVAAGNRYYTFNSQPGLGYPSISPNVVSVGATWAASYAGPVTFSTGASESAPTVDHIVSLTQRSSVLSILAPGAWITSTWLNNTLANQDNLLKLLQATGVTIVDSNYGTDNVGHTNLTFKRVNLKAAMDTVGQPIAPPTLAPIPNQTLAVGGTIVVPLSVTSPSGSPITFTSTQVYLPAQAYRLDQQFGFSYLGSYYVNNYGANEKWIVAAGNIWYCLLPNGELRRWAGTMSNTLTPANLITALDASYYADPAKLWNAPYAGMPPAVFSFSGAKLSIRSPAYWLGTYRVIVSASDGRRPMPTETPSPTPPKYFRSTVKRPRFRRASPAISLPCIRPSRWSARLPCPCR